MAPPPPPPAIALAIALLSLLACSSFFHLPCAAQNCSTAFVFNQTTYNLSTCLVLPVQGAKLAWTYHSSNHSADLAFSGTAGSSSGWVGWGINPTAAGSMAGSSALVAFQSSANGSNVLPYKLTTAIQSFDDPCACTPIDIVVTTTAVEISGTSMSLFVSFKLPSNSSTTLNHVWNRGSAVTSFQPQAHSQGSDDLRAYQVIDMQTGSVSSQAAAPHETLKRVHGILNTISWGILLPLGAIVARYLRPIADPTWFYIHVSLQTLGYVVGIVGWGLGLKLKQVTGASHPSHQSIGLALVVFSTAQVLSLILRPGKETKVRKFWNVYHYALGYSIVVLGIVNIFQGLDILAPGGHWRSGYIASLCLMLVAALLLEIAKWVHYFVKQRATDSEV